MIGVARASSTRGELILLADARVGTTAGAQSYVIPNGTQYIDIELYGAGGGGGVGRAFAVSRVNYIGSGAGGGGGGYVRHGFTGAIGGDILTFTVGNGGTGGTFGNGSELRPGLSGGNTSLSTLTRSGTTIADFSAIIAYGGFGGPGPNNALGNLGGTGGVATGGNISNINGGRGTSNMVGDTSITLTVDGGRGGTGGRPSGTVHNGGTGGIGRDNFGPASIAITGGNGIAFLFGAGGGGGGGYPGDDGLANSAIRGAFGGLGGVRIRSYG